jgi:hypothetical protein
MTISLTLRRVNPGGGYIDLGTLTTEQSQTVAFNFIDSPPPSTQGLYCYQIVAETSSPGGGGDVLTYTNLNLAAMVIKR